jgi:hypothetical protein
MMGVTATIAESVEDYISIAAQLASNPNERRMLSSTIADRKHRVYRDRECISALRIFWITQLGSRQPRPKSKHVEGV